MVFQGSFMVSPGFWLVSMVFQSSFMVSHGFWLISMVFQGSFIVSHGLCLVYHGNTVGRLWPSNFKILSQIMLCFI